MRQTAERFVGRRAIVTGGGSGIGRATAVRLAREGARVAILDRDLDAALAVARELGPDGLALEVDVADEAMVERAVREIDRAWHGLDVLVANAAVQLIGEDARTDRLEIDVWERTIAANLTGVFLACKHALAAMLRSGGGAIVCTGSPTGLYGVAPGFDAYSASKAGVFGLVRALAAGYALQGIRVNAVVPGLTETPLVEALSESERETLLRSIPLRRAGSPDEVASVILFLASDEASYVTGAFYAVDGGVTAV